MVSDDVLERFVADSAAQSTKLSAAVLACPGNHIKVTWVDWDWREWRII